MKKYFVSLLLMMVALTTSAQPQIKVVIDYSKAAFDDYSEKQLKEMYGEEWTEYWENEYKPLVMEEVLDALNDQENMKFIQDGEAPYTLTILLEECDEDGEMDISYILKHQPVGERPNILYSDSYNVDTKKTNQFTNFSTIGFVKASAYLAPLIYKAVGKKEGIKIRGILLPQNNLRYYMGKYKKIKKGK